MARPILLGRSEAEALIDAGLREYVRQRDDAWIKPAIQCLALQWGMIKHEDDFPDWFDRQISDLQNQDKEKGPDKSQGQGAV